MRSMMIIPPKRLAWFYNLRHIFAYKPQSQEYLYKQLFEDSDRKSMSGSLIFNHMQALDEGRLAETASGQNGQLSPQPSPSNRQESMLIVRTVEDEMSFKEVPGRSSSLVITEEEVSPSKKTLQPDNR